MGVESILEINALTCKNIALGLSLSLFIFSIQTVNAAPRFSHDQGTITDSTTKLQWQDSYKNNNGKVKSGSFIQAMKYCSSLALAAKQDWRLPTRVELLSIVDTTRVAKNQPAIQSAFKVVATEDTYHTTTEYEDDPESHWTVDFYHGNSLDVALYTSDGYHIRCVRSK
ncbi:hypothetical protein GCM10009133_36690 [Cocleimonas flava]